MREIDVRNENEESPDCSVKVKFGKEGEYVRYHQGTDTFEVVDDYDVVHLYTSDVSMLIKALKRLEEFVVTVEEDDE